MIKNWFYLRKDAPGLQKETIESPSDTYVNIVDVNSPNSGNIMSVSDFASQSRPYKVYTALLTQSGGDDPLNLLSQDSPSLTIGVTYEITDDGGSGWDFTNVGAPNNDLGTYFVATGTTPADWGTNGMLQYNTGAPVVTVLENTLGNVWFTYDDVGQYRVNSNGLFIENKYVQPPISVSGFDPYLGDGGSISTPDFTAYNRCVYWRNSINLVAVITVNDGSYVDSSLYNTPIEIRVYN
jgi:hypothetical protein